MKISQSRHIKQSSNSKTHIMVSNTINRVNNNENKPTNNNLNLDKTSANNNINTINTINTITNENRVNNNNNKPNKSTDISNNNSVFCCIKISDSGNICNRRKLIFFFLTIVVLILIIGIACGLVFGLKQ